MTTPSDIINFWYSDTMRQSWFASTPELDQIIKNQYEQAWQNAAEGDYAEWQNSPQGCLALVIILDQFPLNMFRGEAKSFSTEQQAVAISLAAVEKGFDDQLSKDQVAFLLMPLMHSENLAHQDLSVELFEKHGLKGNIEFAKHHREIVRSYGRFPHRNAILGRESTPEEIEYLNSDKAFTG